MLHIGVVGNGFVGKATRQLESSMVQFLVYDICPEQCFPRGLTFEELSSCDLIFICVPTPMEQNGKCHLNMVESVVDKLNKIINRGHTSMVIRSTVLPGTSDHLGCYFMPEFLTEKNYLNDFIECSEWIFGLLGNAEEDDRFKLKMKQLYEYAYNENKIKYNKLNFCMNKEAEMIKYFRNCYLATKVSFCNEMEEFCRMREINYERVRELATKDVRIGESHSFVPGHDGKRGFGGTCFPKDTSALLYEMKMNQMESYVLQSVVERNKKVDRSEKDWNESKGRCVVDSNSN
jgi:nucleotide sugar dehydrogenase